MLLHRLAVAAAKTSLRPSLARNSRTIAPTMTGITTARFGSSVAKDEEATTTIVDNSQEENPTELPTAPESTYSMKKSGTPSPWAVFDAWGAGADIVDPLSPAMEKLLESESVKIPMTPEEQATLAGETEILDAYDQFLQRKSSVHFGYPYNLMYNHSELYEFMKYSINNLGDPFVPSNYSVHSRQFECAVIDFFADLWKMEKDSYWGYVTTSGTEGNLHGILLARECHPDAILYTSQETHYSVFKAARYYRMDCQSIPTLPMGEIDYDLLEKAISRNLDRDIIINVNIGTTVKGAVDNLDRILRTLQVLNVPRERFHIHCDGALFALMMPFVDYAPEISFQKPIDSIAVSGHKMLGCPMPCGIALCRKEHVEKVEQHIDYLNSVDTTIMGSRNGQAALYLWYSLRKKGVEGIKRDVEHCMETARYLRDKLTEAGFTCRVNDLSSTVVLERPLDENLVKRWQLACEEDIAHVVVMPNVTRNKIDLFVKELTECKDKLGRIRPVRENSPLRQLHSLAWGGSVVQPFGTN
ncbi:Histidine decarboxylase [Seminavis robusta]|uniref:Histidine decarboxylase n=1 Tax=Seminavis robusta TaxID=568900 RepID=A0A9N8HV27_9STRA|nr:Histidine decarboxylase [Seminavis robusta]|eukprot:Sro1732_g294160.1 Histidine decarboxylase (528) ;mRNA; r:7419-9097